MDLNLTAANTGGFASALGIAKQATYVCSGPACAVAAVVVSFDSKKRTVLHE